MPLKVLGKKGIQLTGLRIDENKLRIKKAKVLFISIVRRLARLVEECVPVLLSSLFCCASGPWSLLVVVAFVRQAMSRPPPTVLRYEVRNSSINPKDKSV